MPSKGTGVTGSTRFNPRSHNAHPTGEGSHAGRFSVGQSRIRPFDPARTTPSLRRLPHFALEILLRAGGFKTLPLLRSAAKQQLQTASGARSRRPAQRTYVVPCVRIAPAGTAHRPTRAAHTSGDALRGSTEEEASNALFSWPDRAFYLVHISARKCVVHQCVQFGFAFVLSTRLVPLPSPYGPTVALPSCTH